MKQQIVVIHGGDSFHSDKSFLESLQTRSVNLDAFQRKQDWKYSLPEKLGDRFEVFQPQMPCKQNAKYVYWSIWIARLLPFLDSRIIFVGHSLGAIFLLKYLSEHVISKTISALVLIAAPHNNTSDIGDFCLGANTDNVSKQVKHMAFFHSTDDPVVPYCEFKQYKKDFPQAKFFSFSDRQHFNQEEFPEFVSFIRSLAI